MLKNESISLTLRALYFVSAAAFVTACGGGNSGSPLPAPVAGGVTTASATSGPTEVQSTSGSAYAPASIAIKFSSVPAAGDVLVVALWNNGQTGGAVNTYTAPSGWTAVDRNTAHAYSTYELFSHVVARGEANDYVFMPQAPVREHAWMAADVANASGISAHGNAFVSSSTSFTTPAVTPSQSGDLGLAFDMPETISSVTWSNPSGWSRAIGATSTWAGQGLLQSLSTTSAVSESATLSVAASGFAGIVLISPAQPATSTATAMPAPTSSPVSTATAVPAASAASVSQWTNGSAYAPSAITVKFPSAPSAGHLLVVAFWNNGQSTGASNTYTPPAGWTLVNQNTSHAYTTYQAFSHLVSSGEANSYTFAPAAAKREQVWMAADTTAASVDKSGNNFVNSSTAFATPDLTPSHSNDLALALNLPFTTSSASWSNSSGWTLGTGPTSTWKGEAVNQTTSSTSGTSESAQLSAASYGFAALLLLSPAQSTAATPAPVASPIASPIAIASPAPTASPISTPSASYHGCPLYAPNDWFTTNLVSNPADPNSANIINNINSNVGNINFAANSQSNLETVNIDNESSSWFMTTINGLSYGFANNSYNDDPSPHQIPVTNGTYYQEGTTNCTLSGNDCHVVVLDTVKCLDYETYKGGGSYGNGVPQSWHNGRYWAEGGGVENLNHAYQVEPITVTAANIPMMGTTDWGEDLQYQQSSCQPNCAIPHIVAFLLPNAGQANGGWVAPADGEQAACSSYCTNAMPEGARLRLRWTYTCPSPSTYPQANLVCNQLKQYGMVLNDFTGINNGGGIRFGTSSNGSDPWNSSDYDQLLSNIHITDFSVMTLGTVHY